MLVEKTTKEGLEARFEMSDEVLFELIKMLGNVAIKSIESPEYLQFCLRNQELVIPFVERVIPMLTDLIEKGDRASARRREQEERRNDSNKNCQQRAR